MARSTTKKTEPTIPDAKFITCDETAKLFRVTGRTIRRWCDEGRFHPVRLGHARALPRFEVVAALNACSDGAPWVYEFNDAGELIAKTAEGKQIQWPTSDNSE